MVKLSKMGLPIPHPHSGIPLSFIKYTMDAAGSSRDPLLRSDTAGVAAVRRPFGPHPPFVATLKWPNNIQEGFFAPDGKSLAHKTTTLELVGILLPFLTDTDTLLGCPVICYTDNMPATRAFLHGRCNKDELASSWPCRRSSRLKG